MSKGSPRRLFSDPIDFTRIWYYKSYYCECSEKTYFWLFRNGIRNVIYRSFRFHCLGTPHGAREEDAEEQSLSELWLERRTSCLV